MRKFTFTLFLLAVIFTVSAQKTSKSILQEHIDNGRQAYLKNADKENHRTIKNNNKSVDYIVGDTKTFWRWDLTVMPPLWVQEPATCRAVGELSYIFIADDQWDVNINQSDVDLSMSFLEDSTLNTTEYGIVAMDTLFFGEIPDEIDNDPKVIFFYSGLGQFNGSVFDGYFSAFNQMTEAEAQATGDHSNECEMLYMSCDPVNPTSLITLSVLSHELQHLIHFGADPDEETWLDEGCAELAMVLFGQPDPISSYNTNPNDNLLVWDQHWSDYIQTMLFVTYLNERFGSEFIRNIVANTNNSVASINEELVNIGSDFSFSDIFSDWVIANFIDDPAFDTGLYGYELLSLPSFSFYSPSEYPVNISETMNNCANLYYGLPTTFYEIAIYFTADVLEDWHVSLLCFDESDEIQEVIIPEESDMIFTYPMDYALGKLIYVVANKKVAFGEDDFSFIATDVFANINEINNDISLSVFPNPLDESSKVSINLITSENVTIRLIDITGKTIDNIFTGKLNVGVHSFNIKTQNLQKGLYFINMISDNNSFTEKCIVE